MAKRIDLDARAREHGYRNFAEMAHVELRDKFNSAEGLARILQVSRETIASRTRGMSLASRKADAQARKKGYENMRDLVLHMDEKRMTNYEIAEFAEVSERTVQYYRRRSGKTKAKPPEEKAKTVFISEIDREIALDMAHGSTYKEIGDKHGLAESTIKNRVLNLMQKFEVTSNVHLVSVLISSDVIRTHDLYRPLDVWVTEYRRGNSSKQMYRLDDIKMRR